MGFGYGMGFDAFGAMFSIVFVIVIGGIIITAVKGISEWNNNNNSPRLTVSAKVVGKRTKVSHHHHGGTDTAVHHHTSTTYYVTFQVESGDRMEMHVSGREYGMLVEGDEGMLTFQGTRYLEFERKNVGF